MIVEMSKLVALSANVTAAAARANHASLDEDVSTFLDSYADLTRAHEEAGRELAALNVVAMAAIEAELALVKHDQA